MGTHHFNRKNMFHKVRHSTSVLIFRAYQAPHLDLPICKWGRTRKWPASLKKCVMSSSQLPQRTTPALLNGETIWNDRPKSSLNYTNHSLIYIHLPISRPFGIYPWAPGETCVGAGQLEGFFNNSSLECLGSVNHGDLGSVTLDPLGWLLRSERRGWGHLVSTYFQGHRFRAGVPVGEVRIHRPTVWKYFLNSLQWFDYSLQDTIRYYSLL